ncbi:MAG TPA: hypothetical protein VNT55_05465 [Baekduia sp.]|nr:hypothetical protein [Baekduia sp.]
MTLPHLHRSSGTLARSALLALVLAGCAGTAASQDRASDPGPARTAILAGSDAPAAALTAAATDAGAAAEIRHASGPFDTQAQATRLAAEGYDTIIAVGASARAAVSQASAAEIGDDTTSWRAAAR